MTNPWLSPNIAAQQRALVDQQLQQSPMPAHLAAYAAAIRSTQCPGEILEVGAASGYGVEVLYRAGVPYAKYVGIDISPAAIALAKERYPESTWICDEFTGAPPVDLVCDSACLMHVDGWREHLAALCRSSRRHVILHRVPFGDVTERTTFSGYGHDFPAWRFRPQDVVEEMERLGFKAQLAYEIGDPGARTLTFAKPRQWVTYADSAYLPRLRALHASMVRHCGPFELHVLAWDQGVADWCATAPSVSYSHIDNFLKDVSSLQLEALPGPPRTRVEHMFSVAPAWIAEIMEETGQSATYVDCDLYAISSPEPFFAEAGGAPAAFVGHNFAPASRGCPGPTMESHAHLFGSLNVGLCHFNDKRSAEAWARLVRTWCFDRVDVFEGNEVFADQKYLEWLVANGDVIVIKNEAAMVGPWNVNARSLWLQDGVPHFGGRPIGFYHFSALQLGPHGQWSPSRPEYHVSERAIDLLYNGYVRELDRFSKETP